MKIAVTVKGMGQLLQHRFPVEDHLEDATKKRKKVYSAQEDAETSLYKKQDGTIFQPANHFEAALVKAGANYKFEGRKTFKDAIKGGVFITPNEIPHKNQEWEMDLQPVVIQRARIVRARPRFDKWELDFEIECIDDRVSFKDLKEIMVYAGLYVGVGDMRPRYGRFEIIKFEEIK